MLKIARLLLTLSILAHYNKDGNTAYHIVVRLVDRYDIFEEILRYSTKLDIMNSIGETVLYLTVKFRN